MALIDCPSCRKKMSDKAQQCSHCEFTLGAASAEDIHRKQSLNRYLKTQKVQTQSMLAMLMFVAGFGFMYWGGTVSGDLQHSVAIGVAIVGFVWYVVNRVRLVFLKKSD